VTKCWAHPDSDKLLCEEVDLGEGSVRRIASGIRLFYSPESFEGRKVLVLANLKERSIAGFKSQGMVLCASNDDHTVVELIVPPASANIGDRVLFEDIAVSEPATPAQMTKKKVFEGLAPELRTNAEGLPTWRGHVMTINGQRLLPVQPNAHVA
jgi:tRNA-binding EMAP/Myf-like protein